MVFPLKFPLEKFGTSSGRMNAKEKRGENGEGVLEREFRNEVKRCSFGTFFLEQLGTVVFETLGN